MSQNLHEFSNTPRFNRSMLNILSFGLLAGMAAPAKMSMIDSIPKIKTSGLAGKMYRTRKNKNRISTISRRKNRS